MVHGGFPSRRDRTAIGLSIAAHLCALAVLAALPHPAFTPDVPDERVLLATMIRIEHRETPRPAPVVRAAPPLAAAALSRPPLLHVAHTVAHAQRALVVASERRFSPRAFRASVAKHVAAPAVVAVLATPAAAATAVAAGTTAAATASPVPSPIAAVRDDGIGNFGETYPAAVDPSARGALFGGIAGPYLIRITVDETGRATAVEFVRAPADPGATAELRSRLMAARFIPAACNGLRCAGTLELSHQ